MKISFVLPAANMTGGTKAVAELGTALQARGHSISVISAAFSRPPLRLRYRLYRDAILSRENLPRFGPEPNHIDQSGLEHIVRKNLGPIRNKEVPDSDAVVATWWRTAEPVYRLSQEKGAKVYFMQDYGAPGMAIEQLIPTWQLPMHMVTISEWLANLVTEHVGPRQIDIMPDGVDSGFFSTTTRAKPTRPTIGFLYREIGVKGYDIVRSAFEMARKSLPDLRLITAGPTRPSELPLPEGMEFVYQPTNDALKNIYAGCDAWLFASRLEGFGLPILESMACGTPVIATRAGASPEIVSRGGGRLLSSFDPSEMAEAIVSICSMDGNTWESLSAEARQVAELYTWPNAAKIFEDAILTAMQQCQ